MKIRLSPALKILPAVLLALAVIAYVFYPRDTYQALKELHGPLEKTLPAPEPGDASAVWDKHSTGGTSRLALLLTDPSSAWLGVQQALASMGIPYVVTADVERAVQHRVILAYPVISGKVLSHAQHERLRQHVAGGGCLLATQVLGNDLKDLFGFTEAQETRDHYELKFSADDRLTRWMTHERELTTRLGNPRRPNSWIGTQHFTSPEQVLATYQDGKAAWICKDHPSGGRAMALGFDLGFYILKCQNDRDDEASRLYVNGYEPSVDVWLRLLREMYRQYEPRAVTVDTVPDGKRISAIMTLDIDYVKSMANMIAYRDLLVRLQTPTTFFIQAKYYRDFFDTGFFNDESVALLHGLEKSGMEVASHSVAHSDVFAKLPLGTGTEKYPDYQPRVHAHDDTRGASILGEMRVSKFLLEKLAECHVRSFRPGYLACPPTLPQALEASGYLYTSSVTAASVMTYLPYRKNFNREYAAPTSVIEFPVAVEDEHPPAMDQRVDAAMVLAERLATYGGSFTVLSHPDVIEHKYRFFELIIPRLKPLAWIGTIGQFGDWWNARDQIEIDVDARDQRMQVTVDAPLPIKGVTLHLPTGWKAARALPEGATLENGRLFLPQLQGALTLEFLER